MWLFTRHGFFSAVCARNDGGSSAIDKHTIMVRARSLRHLENLKYHFPDLLGERPILVSPKNDYRYRIFVSKSAWSEVLARLAEETDYDNFKGSVQRAQGKGEYLTALHDVWHTMQRLQQ